MEFDEDQVRVIQLVKDGHNVFFTGDAGTGKSAVLGAVIDLLRMSHEPGEVAVTAATGIAAINVGGTTLHAAMGCGAPTSPDHFLSMWTPRVARRLRTLRALVIDEISMVSAELFYVLDHMLRQIRDDDAPYGRLQLVACGDFLQLPPVSNDFPTTTFLNRGMAFQSPSWPLVNWKCVVLRKVWRQSDEAFVGLLRRVRIGDASAAFDIQRRCAAAPNDPSLRLVTTNRTADRANSSKIDELPGNIMWARAADRTLPLGEPGTPERDSNSETLATLNFFRDCPAPEKSRLKKGARVILVKNIEPWNGLVNGAIGTVREFVHRDDFLEEQRRRGRLGDDYRRIVAQWGTARTMVPVVEWSSGRVAPCGPRAFDVDMAGVGACRRIQLPLKLAWAITVHRSQGMTLDSATVSLTRCFADGQAYVALSRARSFDTMHVAKLRDGCVRACPEARRFHDAVEKGEPYECTAAWEAMQVVFPTTLPHRTVLTAQSTPRCFKCGSDDHLPFECTFFCD